MGHYHVVAKAGDALDHYMALRRAGKARLPSQMEQEMFRLWAEACHCWKDARPAVAGAVAAELIDKINRGLAPLPKKVPDFCPESF